MGSDIYAEIMSDSMLARALRRRFLELGATLESVDQVAGFTPGYSSKLLGPQPIRRMGMVARHALVGTLGLRLILIVAPERISPKLTMRGYKLPMLAVKVGRGKHREVSKRFLRKIAPRGGNMRAYRLSPRRRKQIARHAARTRWAKAASPSPAVRAVRP